MFVCSVMGDEMRLASDGPAEQTALVGGWERGNVREKMGGGRKTFEEAELQMLLQELEERETAWRK